MRILTKTEELEAAYRQWHERLAEFMVGLINLENVIVVLDAGCGNGGLTMPLAAKIGRRCKIIAYDLASGPYEGSLEVLKRRIEKEGLEGVIEIVKGDVKDMKSVTSGSVDLIVSNDLFCDLDRTGLESTLKEFYRILKRKGQMVHAELSPVAENRAQELLIEADLHYSLEPMLPEGAYWFSPTVDDVAILMHKIGFRNICVRYFETDLRLSYDVAVDQFKRWKVDMRFVEEHGEDLRDYGLEFPLEHVVVCEKF